MAKYKIKHVGWFFGFLGNCVRDVCTEPIDFFKYKIGQENWEDFNTRIYFDTDPKAKKTLEELDEAIKQYKEERDEKNN